MLVLVVEDEPEFSREIEAVLTDISGQVRISFARSRDSAIHLLEAEFYDLIILDLKIPTLDGALDADPLHGHSTFTKARVVAPGTPILVLTGSSVEDFIPDMLNHQQQMDVWGTGTPTGTIIFLRKLEFDKFPDLLRPKVEAIEALGSVELHAPSCNLTTEEDRLLRIFARQKGGTICRADTLSGLSGVKVLKLEILGTDGTVIHNAVAKLGDHAKVELESNNYQRHIVRLEPQYTPRHLATLRYGAKAVSGVFFSLVPNCRWNYFTIEGSPVETADVLDTIKAAISPWNTSTPHTRVTVRQVRQRLLDDAIFTDVCHEHKLDWAADFENNEVQVKWACIHGDLHGANVLISEDGEVQLIDYGDVSEGPVCLDPITLELSFLLHPDVNCEPWPTLAQTMNFLDIDSFLQGCPFPEAIRLSREWANEAKASMREYYSVLYAYLVRNLQYADTDKALILRLLIQVKTAYEAT